MAAGCSCADQNSGLGNGVGIRGSDAPVPILGVSSLNLAGFRPRLFIPLLQSIPHLQTQQTVR